MVLQATAPLPHDIAPETVTLQHSCHEWGDTSLSFLQPAAFEQRKSRPPANGDARQRLPRRVLSTSHAVRPSLLPSPLTPHALRPPLPHSSHVPRPSPTPLVLPSPHSSHVPRPSPTPFAPRRSSRLAFLRVCRRRRWPGRHATSSGRNRLRRVRLKPRTRGSYSRPTRRTASRILPEPLPPPATLHIRAHMQTVINVG